MTETRTKMVRMLLNIGYLLEWLMMQTKNRSDFVSFVFSNQAFWTWVPFLSRRFIWPRDNLIRLGRHASIEIWRESQRFFSRRVALLLARS